MVKIKLKLRDGVEYTVRVHRSQPNTGVLTVEDDHHVWDVPVADIVSSSIVFDFSYQGKSIDRDSSYVEPILDG